LKDLLLTEHTLFPLVLLLFGLSHMREVVEVVLVVHLVRVEVAVVGVLWFGPAILPMLYPPR
jgi:hypothetical protein